MIITSVSNRNYRNIRIRAMVIREDALTTVDSLTYQMTQVSFSYK